MKTANIESGLALAGALLVIVGVMAAAGSALADESRPANTAATELSTPQNDSLTNAEAATQTAVNDAVASVVRNNRQDLDIRLVDHTS